MPPILVKVDSEITKVLGRSWTELTEQSEGFVAVHTILVVWLAIKSDAYAELNKWE